MEIKQLLRKLKLNNVDVHLSGEDIEINYDDADLTEEILNEIRAHKQEIISFLKQTVVQTETDNDIPKAWTQESYAISDAQRRLWVLSQFEGGSVAYNIPGSISLNQDIDIDYFKRAIDSTIERHEILRTVFKEDEAGEIRQWILQKEDLGFKIDYKDFRKEQNKEDEVELYITEDSYKAFDLEKGPLLRASLLQVEDDSYVFYFNMHHSISDGWSMEVLSKDVFSYYEAYKGNKQPDLKELRIQYKDYSAWALAQLEEESYKAHRAYWLNSLSGELPLLDLPTTKQRPRIKTSNGRMLGAYLDKELSQKLKDYSQQRGGTVFMGLLASLNAILYRYTGQDDLIIGCPVAGREHTDLESQIGFYVNTLALRNEIHPEDNFDELFSRIKQNTLNAYSHQMYPFDKLVEELGLQRDTSRSAVFDVMLAPEYSGERTEGVDPIAIRSREEELNQIIDHGSKTSKFDLLISIKEQDYISLSVEYNTDVYEREMIEGLINHYKQLLQALLENPEEKVSQIDYLSREEKHELLFTFNDTEVAYPKDKTIVDLFEEQVAETPDNVAVVFKKEKLTYEKLDELSNQLARYLQKNYAIKPGDLVGIKQQRSEWMIISILGILKSGGAYVPIDPGYPQDRIDYIEKDTACKVCIDEEELTKFKEVQKEFTKENLKTRIMPDNLAYVIYTSGSTGRPKGVMIEHRNVVRLFKTGTPLFDFKSSDVWTMFHSYAFDFSVWEMYGALFFGGKLVVVPKIIAQDTNLYLELLEREGVTVLNQTPSAFYNLSKETESNKADLRVRYVIFGGEALSPGKLQYWNEHYPTCQLINMYGITETTVHTTYKEITQEDIKLNRSNIGKAIPTVSCLILDQNKSLVPSGIAGELYVGGEGVARGYLNRVDLTSEKFIENPFKEGEKLYRSGDKAKQLPNGDFEYLGRVDDQVKIRGYRIELGEIEHALLKNEQIEEVVVLAKENQNNEKELVAYITSKLEQNTSDLRSYLKEVLPEYMLPAYYVQLDTLPLTSNGKIDRKSLPDPQGLGLTSGIEYVAPRNEIEEKLVMIWGQVLKKEIEEIGIDEGFFTLGGNSIKLMALKSKIERAFKVDCSVAFLFQFSTIRLQSEMLLKGSTIENVADVETNDLTSVFRDERNGRVSNDIAVIGMSIKAPGSKNIREFWKNLRNGKESITHFSEEELNSFDIPTSDLSNKDYVPANSYLEDKEYFDSSFFGYLPDEAKLMDPQTRVFHEVVWSALEDSGYDPLSYKGLIGLYAGAGDNLEWEAYSQISNKGKVNGFFAGQLSNKDFSNTLIAHKLNLKGPVNSINTACSTSLVAIHYAVRSILTGENHIAIAGGVSISSKRKEKGYLYQEGMITSKDGHNRTFDSDSSGTVVGEGAGAVVLKKLSHAIEDGDHIYSIIKGSAINNDGNRKVGFTAPSVDGQAEVIRLAHKVSGIKPESISYVEAHGTATKLGDPIEVLALAQAFGKSMDKYCALGSVKTNIGHLDTAAGVAGFIKTVLCLKNKELVPSLHFKSPNTEINFKESPFYVNTELKEWPRNNFPRRAGVSAFGIGGTNAHIVLEEGPDGDINIKNASLQLIPLSAKTNEALLRQQEDLKEFLRENRDVNLADVARTLQNKRSFSYRSCFVAQTTNEAIVFLETTATSKLKNKGAQIRGKKIAFLFPGGGSQYENMGRDLYEIEKSVFRKTMDQCFEVAEKLSPINFKGILYPDKPDKTTQVNEIVNALPILFMFEYSLAKYLECYGVRPDIMIGHSMGEYVAACIAGVLTVEGALTMVIRRAELMQELPKGGMLAVEISADQIQSYLSGGVNIAAINSPTSCVISGDEKSIIKLSKKFEEEAVSAKLLHISIAAHSVMMDSILDKFTKLIEKVKIRSPKIAYISNLTGMPITQKELDDRSYWSGHIRNTVQFSSGINEILSHNNIVLIEVGPGHALSNLAREHFKENTSAEVHQLVRHSTIKDNDNRFLSGKISDLWRSGVEIEWSRLHSEKVSYKVSLPTYPFERTQYPMGEGIAKMISKRFEQTNNERRLDGSEWYYEPTWKKSKLSQRSNANQEDDWYLIFNDRENISQELILPRLGSNKTILVKIGSGYKKIKDLEFELNPYEYDGYEKLFNELSIKGIHPSHVIHLLSLHQDMSGQRGRELIEKNKILGFYSLLHIAKELNKIENGLPINLSVITNNLEVVFDADIIQPSKSLISGLLIVISQENPLIQNRLIDIALDTNREKGIADLVKEIKSTIRDKFIAYRNNMRWVKDFNRLLMPSTDENGSRIKTGGTYLITGGLGGLGFTYSKYLLEKYKANLILIGRSEFSDGDGHKDQERKNRLQSLQEIGNVSYHIAAISDIPSMRRVIEKAEQEFGKINGVIHTAGLVQGDSFTGINFLSVAECEKQFDPKMNGVHVIEELFRNKELDFCLLTSSLASIIGGKEFGAYAPASTYMDYFSHEGKIKNCVSVNFGTLYFNEEIKPGSEFYVQDALDPHDILKVLEMVLSVKDPQILVSPIELEPRIKKWVYPKPEDKPLVIESQVVSVEVERSNLSTVYSPPISETEKEVYYLFEAFFGITEIGIDDNFFELGGNSLKAMTLISRIHKKFNILLKIHDIFGDANIRNLSKRIDLLTGISQMKQKRTKMNFENKIEL